MPCSGLGLLKINESALYAFGPFWPGAGQTTNEGRNRAAAMTFQIHIAMHWDWATGQ